MEATATYLDQVRYILDHQGSLPLVTWRTAHDPSAMSTAFCGGEGRVTELSRGQSTGTLRRFWRTGEDNMGKAGGILDITAGAAAFVGVTGCRPL